jgi:hypothetical protein
MSMAWASGSPNSAATYSSPNDKSLIESDSDSDDVDAVDADALEVLDRSVTQFPTTEDSSLGPWGNDWLLCSL